MKLIDIKNLKFEYFRRDDEGNVEEMIEAIKGVSLDVEQGQFIAILGKNGSGKSTLAKHINALLLPSEGEVIVDGMDIEDEELRLHVRQTAGMVFQNPDNQFVANVVEEDVAFGPENIGVPTGDIWNRVNSSLELTKMDEYRTKSPNHLSGGQKQKVAIAGVLAMEPKCIIFDEATSMLDAMSRKNVLEVAKRLCQENGITIVWITHYMDEVVVADRVFVMLAGEIRMQGAPVDIFDDERTLKACGLDLPPLWQYMDFLVNNNIITSDEKKRIHSVKQLSGLLTDKYGALDCEGFLGHGETRELGRDGLIFDKVTYVYNKGFAGETLALDELSLYIGKGEFVAVIGPTGSGKSTLMQHFNGLLLPTEGAIYYDGQDIAGRDFSIKQLRQKVGLVFQYPEYQLFADTVEKDVCFGPRNMNITPIEAQKRAYKAIADVGLPDTIYDVSPFQLSGGQKRRVAIAGVLAMRPEFLVLDEPTAGMDPESSRALLQMLKRLQEEKGISIIMVSHNLEEVAEYADRVIVLNKGSVCMDDYVEKVFSNEELLEQLGLDIPVGVKLVKGLKNVTKASDVVPCRREEIFGTLLKIRD